MVQVNTEALRRLLMFVGIGGWAIGAIAGIGFMLLQENGWAYKGSGIAALALAMIASVIYKRIVHLWWGREVLGGNESESIDAK